MLRYPDDLDNLLANYEMRLKELERRLLAINDDPPGPSIDCCDTYCDFQVGATELAAGAAADPLVSVTIPRPASGRFTVRGGHTSELLANGDFYVRTQWVIGGTRYYPIRRWRNQAALDGDFFAPEVGITFDFVGPAADLTVGLYVQNLGTQSISVSDGEMALLMRGRGGSTACDPVSSGSS